MSVVTSAKGGDLREQVGHKQFTKIAEGPSTPPASGYAAMADWEVWLMKATWSALCHSRYQKTGGPICPGGDKDMFMNDRNKNIIGEFFSVKYR